MTSAEAAAVLPQVMVAEIADWPEFRMGVKRVRVQLADGRTFENVIVSGDRVVKVLGFDMIPFSASDVIAVVDSADAPLPLGY